MYNIEVTIPGFYGTVLEYTAPTHPQVNDCISCYAGKFVVSNVEHVIDTVITQSSGKISTLHSVILEVVGR